MMRDHTDPSRALPTGSVIGILGGGQLGRMLSVAAGRLGYLTHIYDPQPSGPASQLSASVTVASYEDAAALEAFARSVDVITYEFENIPAAALDRLEALRPIHPGRRALEVSQDRVTEKQFLEGLGLPVAPWQAVDGAEDLASAYAALGAGIVKTRRFGYDGKGQSRVMAADGAQTAWEALGQPAVYERLITFSAEISVIIGRAADGQVAAFDPGRNEHHDGILRTTSVPAQLPAALLTDAVLAAAKIAGALDYVGVMGVEFFVSENGLLINEIAPRVHNSGHWTQAGCLVDQFEQHIRAVSGLPLADGTRHADVVMENLIGDDLENLPEILRDPTAQLHLYGKPEMRPGRKMGHVNRIPR